MSGAYVYIMANHTRTMYAGVTTDLHRRVWERKNGYDPDVFTSRYRLHILVFIAEFARLDDAIAYEKYVKGKKRAWKMGLGEQQNPRWNDLGWNWYQGGGGPSSCASRRVLHFAQDDGVF